MKESPAQLFSGEFCDIFYSNFLQNAPGRLLLDVYIYNFFCKVSEFALAIYLINTESNDAIFFLKRNLKR